MANNIVAENEIFFTAFEPKVKNRFLLSIEGVPAYIIKKLKRPQLEQEPIKLPHINTLRYVKGMTKWGTIDLTLYDPVVPSGAQAVMEWVRLHHESVTGRDGYAEFYKKDLTLQVLGPVGDKVEEWIIKGAQITKADFGEMEWSDTTDAVNIELTIQPDYCVLNY
jgi:hypothetical protein